MTKMRMALTAIMLVWMTTSILAEDRALIIGVEKYQAPNIKPALGAERDANDVEVFVHEKLGFPPAAIRTLTGARATSRGIQNEVKQWLIAGTKAGDRVFLYYSGHGSYLPDDDGDEKGDQYDETIVPYDATLNGGGMIRDDQFARWIAELEGRRIVMIFDSCHSGTISRGTFSTGANEESARFLVPDESQLQDKPRSRNLLEVSDGRIGDRDRISRQSDAVIISAAGAQQTAHAMPVKGQWRGALTYGLIEIYNNGAPNLSQLRAEVKSRIQAWQQSRQLNGKQIPEFELSSPRLESEPIFGLWENVPQIALVNPASKLKVSLNVRETGKPKNARGHLIYYEGENISYRITTDTTGYLYLMAFSQDPQTGKRYVSLLYPYPGGDAGNGIAPPGISLPEGAQYPITATGLDVTVALVTTRKLPLEIKAEYSWEEMFQALKLKQLQQEVSELSRGVNVRLNEFDWQAATLPVFTTNKN